MNERYTNCPFCSAESVIKEAFTQGGVTTSHLSHKKSRIKVWRDEQVTILSGCEKCGKTTELHYHCDNKTTHLSGNQRIDNNIVNILSSLVGAIIGVLIYQFT